MSSPSITEPRKGKSIQTPTYKAHWDVQSNEIFIRLCVEQVKAHNRPGTHLNKQGWDAVIDKFKSATGRLHNRIQMKNHWDVLKKEWGMWKNLLRGDSGLGRDPLTGAISASDEWWNNKLQRYPDAAKFRDNLCNLLTSWTYYSLMSLPLGSLHILPAQAICPSLIFLIQGM